MTCRGKNKQWLKAALWPANNMEKNITYEQQCANLKKMYGELGIYMAKLTHAGRVAGANDLDACGIDDKVREGLQGMDFIL